MYGLTAHFIIHEGMFRSDLDFENLGSLVWWFRLSGQNASYQFWLGTFEKIFIMEGHQGQNVLVLKYQFWKGISVIRFELWECVLCFQHFGWIIVLFQMLISQGYHILSSQVVSLPWQSVIQEVANFCAAMDTLIDQDGIPGTRRQQHTSWHSVWCIVWGVVCNVVGLFA